VINVVVLQNSKDLLKGELGSCSKTCTTSTVDGNEAIGIEAERVLDILEGNNQQTTTFTVIKIEQNVSCVPVFTVTHISYKLYPGLPVYQSVLVIQTFYFIKLILNSF
jgi:hypothetical protein